MSKKRIHELAKEYGMSGKDLAGKLRDLGFTQIKSHMSALDEFEELQVQGVLEAHGYKRPDAPDASNADLMDDSLGAGLIRRKKKKKAAADDSIGAGTARTAATQVAAPDPILEATQPAPEVVPQASLPTEVEPEIQPVPVAEQADAVEPPVSVPEPEPVAKAEPIVEVEPIVEAQAEPEVEEVVPTPEVVATTAPTELDPEPVNTEIADEPSPAPAEPVAVPEPIAAAEPVSEAPAPITEPREEEEVVVAITPTPAPAAAPAAAPATAATEEAPVVQEKLAEEPVLAAAKETPDAESSKTKVEDKSAKKARPGPAGKVVGFIDLSKIQAAPKKSESRRLRSRDDVLPDVRPTLRHDSKNSMLRGDRGSRGQLTAAQLREREAGRYKRHQRPTGGRGRGGDRGGRGGSRPNFEGSPFSGQTIKIDLPVTIRKLAESMSIKGNQLLKVAWRELGFGAVNITSTIDQDTAELLAGEYEVGLEFIREVAAEEALIESLKQKRDAIEDVHLERRNPTVAFLGHVDHGKTTLIDKIRSSTVADGEAGGITQHIGAYRVTTENGHHVTIIDTPGHAAFTSMRARGAEAVDVVVLVVAADAGVQPQTEEALAHARAAKAPIVIAMNKIDRPEANVQKTLEQLAGIDAIPEEWGGEIAVMPVSGITGEGIQELLERISLESEILELDCHAKGAASGIVLEAEVQQGRGIVAHLLVQDGTLNRGDVILAGEGYGRVRSIHNDLGSEIEDAGPSVPIEVSGLSSIPGIGEMFHVVAKLDEAKKVAEERSRKQRSASMAESRKLDNAALLQQVAGPAVEEVNIIIRADVQGTVEVLKTSIQDPIHTEVIARVLQAGVGAVTENDILLASTSNALVVAFNVATGTKARQAAERAGVEIRNFSILYNVIDTIRAMMEGRLAPEISEEVTGHVEIRRLFRSSKIGNIAGSYVLDGTISRDSKIRLMRDDQVIYTGLLGSLKREAEDAKEVREGFECGLVVRNYNDIREGDVLEAYKIIETARTLESPARATT
ncbi:MAG: translation initiation factor IF-2 [Planctomycetota bacterium]